MCDFLDQSQNVVTRNQGVLDNFFHSVANGPKKPELVMKLKFLTLSPLHRQEKRRDGCCCCVALPDNYKESSFAKRNLLRTCMNKYVGPALLSLPGKVSICRRDMNLSLIHRPSYSFIICSLVILSSLLESLFAR